MRGTVISFGEKVTRFTTVHVDSVESADLINNTKIDYLLVITYILDQTKFFREPL